MALLMFQRQWFPHQSLSNPLFPRLFNSSAVAQYCCYIWNGEIMPFTSLNKILLTDSPYSVRLHLTNTVIALNLFIQNPLLLRHVCK